MSPVCRIQAALADEVERRELVATLPQTVWITRPDGYHVYFNQQWMDPRIACWQACPAPVE